MCNCDGDRPDFFNEKTVTAKKQYKCCECRTPIVIGERYMRSSGKWDGDVCSFKTCLSCNEAKQKLGEIIDCVISFRELGECLSEYDFVVTNDEDDSIVMHPPFAIDKDGRFAVLEDVASGVAA